MFLKWNGLTNQGQSSIKDSRPFEAVDSIGEKIKKIKILSKSEGNKSFFIKTPY